MEKNHITVITGASRGIGKACAIGLSKQGHRVVLVARNKSLLQQVADEINALTAEFPVKKPLVWPLDITVTNDVLEFADKISAELGRIDILINNAGITSNGTLDVSIAEFDQVFKTNLLAQFALIKAVVPIMKKQGCGYIFNIASRAGKLGFAGKGVYGATKFGLVGLSESLYRELSEAGISVTAICPGWVNTEMAQQGGTPLAEEDMIQPEDILKTIQWLLALSPNTRIKDVVIECDKSIA